MWEDGRLLLIAGGLSFVLYGAWIARSLHPADADVSPRTGGIGFVLGGVAMIGGGLDHLDPDAPWLLLCVPAAVGFLGFAVRHLLDWQLSAFTGVLGLIALAIAAIELI